MFKVRCYCLVKIKLPLHQAKYSNNIIIFIRFIIMVRKCTTSLGLLLFSGSLFAMSAPPSELHTEIVFTNSTPDTLMVTLSGDANVKQNVTQVLPQSTVSLVDINRHVGIDDQLNIQLSSANYQINLLQQSADNQFSFGANAGDLTVGMQQDTEIQRYQTTLNGHVNTLAFSANDLDDGGKVRYVLQQEDIKPVLGGANQLNLLSYNIWASSEYSAQEINTRMKEMPKVLSGYDVLVLTEVLDKNIDKKLLNNIATEYPYQSKDIFEVGRLIASGIRVLSHWPVEDKQYLKFNACNAAQCIITRGVTYMKINKQGKPYHIFATHPQAFDDVESREGRLLQLQEMRDFIKGMNIPADEAVILAGDFNINKIGLPADRDYMETILSATEPENRGHTLTYDSNTNFWAEKPYIEYLDYTLIGNDNLQPTSAYQEVFVPRSTKDDLWGKWNLSDHYPVRGVFIYPN
ncbi:MAG: endonuclease/exonuclease/phosphatase family metal-dependent hydrolase [Moritella sp.]|jgi:endonuclease/exonuclease/phosphatase family metal-dependent hydrolase